MILQNLFNLNNNTTTTNQKDPSIKWFIDQIGQPEHECRQRDVKQVIKHLHRFHDVKKRQLHTYTYKGKKFVPTVIILQDLKTIINFHTAYLVGNPVSITGTSEAVETINTIYRKGMYSKTDWMILADLLTYGNAFEYVYYDPKDKTIKSKIFRNADSYPIYNEHGEYAYFVESWKDSRGDNHYTIYFPDHIDTYINYRLVDSSRNPTGLPIHYVSMERAMHDQFGEPMALDLIPILDKIEHLLSKEDDAVTILSLNPIFTIQGQNISEGEMLDSNVSGHTLHLEEGQKAEYVTAMMDYNVIKHELDQLYQHFNVIAAVPSSILGQSNVSNVSESTTSIIYQLTENRGKQNMNALLEGFRQRWKYMRKLSDPMTDYDFDSLNVVFNITKPVDTKQNMENMKMQYDMGAISKRTIIEQSPYTTDSAQELERLKEEGKDVSDRAGENG